MGGWVTRLLVAQTAGVGLLASSSVTRLLGLLLVDVLHQDTLVLEGVTLALEVQIVVQVPVDLLGLTVLLEHAAENAHAANPEDLLGHTSITGTLALTGAGVATLALGLEMLASASTRVDHVRLLADQVRRNKLADGLSRVGTGDARRLIGVDPDLALAALQHDRGQASQIGRAHV